MKVDLITRPNFSYATQITCDNILQRAIALNPDEIGHLVLSFEPLKRAASTHLENKQSQSAMSSNAFTARKAGKHSNPNLTKPRNPVFPLKKTDNTQRFFGKDVSIDILADSEKSLTDFFKL